MAAPRVVAKGRNYLALRIRQKALEHRVPVVENPPLARALYRQVEVGQEIPVELYRAVAEVLAYVFRLMKGWRGGEAGKGEAG
jgi:flagellar biosynthetic protein FlhB